MMNQRRILGIHWYDFVRNEEVARLSQLPPIIDTISQRRHALFGHVRRMDHAAPAHQALHLSVTTRQGLGQLNLAHGEDHEAALEDAGSNKSPRTQGSLFLMLGVLRRIGRRGGCYNPLSVKREREISIFAKYCCLLTIDSSNSTLIHFGRPLL